MNSHICTRETLTLMSLLKPRCADKCALFDSCNFYDNTYVDSKSIGMRVKVITLEVTSIEIN